MHESSFYMVLIALITYLFLIKVPWYIKVAYGYFLITTLIFSMWPTYVSPVTSLMPRVIGLANVMALGAMRDLMMIAFLPLLFFYIPKKVEKHIEAFVTLVLCYDAYQLITTGTLLFDATTFDACVLACWIHKVNYKTLLGKFVIGLFLVAMISVHARDAALIVGVSTLIRIYPWLKKNLMTETLCYLLGTLSIIAIAFGCYYIPIAIGDVRFEIWENMMDWWALNVDHWFGGGLGSFEWLGPFLYSESGAIKNNYGYFLLHNDWLQTLFETGWLGLTCITVLFLYGIRWLRGVELAIWVSIGVGMCFYYPLHSFPVQIICLGLMRSAIEQWRTNKSEHAQHHRV